MKALTKDEFEKRLKEKYGDKYEIIEYTSLNKPAIVKCKIHNKVIKKRAENMLKSYVCDDCRKYEKALALYQKVYEKVKDKFEIDFNDFIGKNMIGKIKLKCKKHNIVIEKRIDVVLNAKCPEVLCELCKNENPALVKNKKEENKNITNKRKKRIIKSTEDFIKYSKEVFGENRFDYSLVDYKDYNTPITLKCNICGTIFNVIPKKHFTYKYGGCPKCAGTKLTQEEFIDRLKRKYKDKFDYSLVKYKNYKTPVKIICNKCKTIFEVLPISLLYKNVKCPNCYKKEYRENRMKKLEEFIEDAINVHGDGRYDYSLVDYKGAHQKVNIICNKCGNIFSQKPNDHLNGYGCPYCSTTSSSYEEELYNFLKDLGIKNIIRKDRNVINPYELDILLPDYNLAIEIHGLFWHSLNSTNINKWNYLKNIHKQKVDMCESKGIRLLQIFENEWVFKKDIWKSIILSKLGIYDNIIYGRKCNIIRLNNSDVSKFLNENHLQGYIPAKINLALEYNGDIVMVATFGKSRFHKDENIYELYRFASLKYTKVIGGFSKLIRYFVNNYLKNGALLITYADRRYTSKLSNVYEKSNLFKFVKYTKPNYYYFVKSKYIKDIKLESRLNFQKHKLEKILDKFNSNLSEFENVILLNKHLNYCIIFDAGNMLYRLK